MASLPPPLASLTIWPFFGQAFAVGFVAPNPRRTIYANNCGDVGAFNPYWSTENDVATFDLTFILAEDEIVVSVSSFDLSPEGPGTVTDPTPSDRIIGSPGISLGAAVSQQFGNWQPDIPQILYRVNMSCLTSFGNTISVYAYVYVNAPPSPNCVC